MRILYISQYFPPENGATQTRAFEMAHNFVQLGHTVTVLTELPNHPSGIIPPEYRGKLFERDLLEGIDVIRVWIITSPVKNFINRMLFYSSFMINAFFAGLILARGKYDLIYATSPPLFVGGVTLALSWLRRLPFIFEVRDLWPEAAIALGELKNQRMIKIATWIEERCYKKARKIIVVTKGFRSRLIQRGIPREKLEVVTNGANLDLFHYDAIQREKIRQEMTLGDKFVVIYAGIHGIAQDLTTIIEAAHILRDYTGYYFLFIGEGPIKAELQNLAKHYDLSNLQFMAEQSREVIPHYLSAADVALVPLRDLEVFKGTIPSKIFDYWACECPIIMSVDGEARKIVEQAKGGIFVPPENPHALVEAIQQLSESQETRIEMGRNGRKYTAQNFSHQALAKQLLEILTAVI